MLLLHNPWEDKKQTNNNKKIQEQSFNYLASSKININTKLSVFKNIFKIMKIGEFSLPEKQYLLSVHLEKIKNQVLVIITVLFSQNMTVLLRQCSWAKISGEKKKVCRSYQNYKDRLDFWSYILLKTTFLIYRKLKATYKCPVAWTTVLCGSS